MLAARQRKRHDIRTAALYVRALLREFRGTLLVLALVVLLGGILFLVTPEAELGGRRPAPLQAFYAAWMCMLAQPPFRPETWYLTAVCALYPVIGFIVIGEGIVRLALLMLSKRQGEKEWMMVMASTYRGHVVLCGLGHLGFRVLQQLAAHNVAVVAIEKDVTGRFLAQAKATGVPVLERDMKDDQALVDAGVPHASALIIASDDDMANLEVALDARRMNPGIRIIMRMFDQQIASKVSGALAIDAAFSSSALAAPMVAALALNRNVLGTCEIAGIPHLTVQVAVGTASPFARHRVDEIERRHGLKVLARTTAQKAVEAPPVSDAVIEAGDTLAVSIAAARLPELMGAGK